MANNPLPPNATGADARDIVFAGCENRGGMAAVLLFERGVNAYMAGVVGAVVGFGVTWAFARHLRKKGHI